MWGYYICGSRIEKVMRLTRQWIFVTINWNTDAMATMKTHGYISDIKLWKLQLCINYLFHPKTALQITLTPLSNSTLQNYLQLTTLENSNVEKWQQTQTVRADNKKSLNHSSGENILAVFYLINEICTMIDPRYMYVPVRVVVYVCINFCYSRRMQMRSFVFL